MKFVNVSTYVSKYSELLDKYPNQHKTDIPYDKKYRSVFMNISVTNEQCYDTLKH